MLIATINHNLPEMTDNLILSINEIKREDKDEIIVIDNGSTKNIANNTTHILDQNIYFGGAVNQIVNLFLNESEQEYLMIVNNDILLRGKELFNTIENEMQENDIDLYSPAIINATHTQCHWKQMLNWNTNSVRKVKWIDFQSPIFNRKFLTNLKQFPNELIYGWGLDFYSGIYAEKNNLNVGVSDNVVFTHLEGQTLKQNVANITMQEFCYNAEKNMNEYFNNNNYNILYQEYRNYGEQYKI